jgi:hypothetical protein
MMFVIWKATIPPFLVVHVLPSQHTNSLDLHEGAFKNYLADCPPIPPQYGCAHDVLNKNRTQSLIR